MSSSIWSDHAGVLAVPPSARMTPRSHLAGPHLDGPHLAGPHLAKPHLAGPRHEEHPACDTA